MNTLIAVGAVNVFFLAILSQTKKNKVLPDHLLSLFLLLLSAAFALVFGALEYGRDGLLLFLVFSNLLYAPVFYFYVVAIVDPNHRLPRCFLWHLLPFALSNLYLIALLDPLSEAQITWLFQEQPFAERPGVFNGLHVLDFAAQPFYLILAWRLLRSHRKRIGDHYSYRESVDYGWLRRLVIALGLAWAVIDVPVFGSLFVVRLTETRSLAAGFSLATLLVFYLAYHGFRQATVFAEPLSRPLEADTELAPDSSEAEPTPRYRRSGLDQDGLQRYRERLLDHMAAERPYLEPEMTLHDLADALCLSEHNTSEVINIGLGQNFYDFVNTYRVAEFQRSVVEEENSRRTLLFVALDCGFNSKSSFNRIFKQHTGLTPSAYSKSQRNVETNP